MTTSYFEEMMAEFGCHSAGGIAMGTIPAAETEGDVPATPAFPYSAQLMNQETPQRYIFHFVLGAPTAPAYALLKKQGLAHTRFFTAPDGVLEAVLTPPSDFYAKSTIYTLLGAVRAALGKSALAPPGNCPLCGLAGCDRYALLEDGYRVTHATCLENRLDLPEQDTTTARQVKGNVALGILGALLGALLAALPVFALMLSRGRVYSAFYAFIPLLSALMYRLLRGKASLNVAAVTVLLASGVAVFLLEQVWFWLMLTVALGYNVPLFVSFTNFFSFYTLGSAIKAMWLSLLFMIVGYLAAGFFLRRYTAAGTVPGRVIRGARFVRESAVPIHPAAGDEDNTADIST